jgi:hypothetical protein
LRGPGSRWRRCPEGLTESCPRGRLEWRWIWLQTDLRVDLLTSEWTASSCRVVPELPWNRDLFTRGDAPPRRGVRVVFAIAIGLSGALLCYGNHLTAWGLPGDFGQSWFGARAILSGHDPYPQVGPGLTYSSPWPLLYPATSFIVAMPFVTLPLLWANVVFVFLSCGLLAYSVTTTGWHRVPMFGSAAFIFAAGSAQWSPLFTAALGIPLLAATFAAKPTIGLALALSGSSRVQKNALVGGIVLLLASLLLLPGWPAEWLANVQKAKHIAPPLLRFGGVFILLSLSRWKRPEARLIVALACVPQTGAWYEALPLFLVPATYYETMLLAVTSSLGFLLYYPRMDLVSEIRVNQDVGALIVALVYLPATIMVLRRPNEGRLPPWLAFISPSGADDKRSAS